MEKEHISNSKQGYQRPQMEIFELYGRDVFTLTIGGNGGAQFSYDAGIEGASTYGWDRM